MLPPTANRHLLGYWDRCRSAFISGDFPVAAFFAITLIEEVGKLPMLAFREPGGTTDRAFRDHNKKYQSAVGWTLIVNSRVSRVYGKREDIFARWFQDGELMRIRNAALYLEVKGDRVITPEEAVGGDTAFLLVCFAGECLAEIQGSVTGTGPDEWKRLLGEVDDFRVHHDLPA